jgi:hypothetical protein
VSTTAIEHLILRTSSDCHLELLEVLSAWPRVNSNAPSRM